MNLSIGKHVGSERSFSLKKDWRIFTDEPQQESPVLVVLMNSATFGNSAFLCISTSFFPK